MLEFLEKYGPEDLRGRIAFRGRNSKDPVEFARRAVDAIKLATDEFSRLGLAPRFFSSARGAMLHNGSFLKDPVGSAQNLVDLCRAAEQRLKDYEIPVGVRLTAVRTLLRPDVLVRESENGAQRVCIDDRKLDHKIEGLKQRLALAGEYLKETEISQRTRDGIAAALALSTSSVPALTAQVDVQLARIKLIVSEMALENHPDAVIADVVGAARSSDAPSSRWRQVLARKLELNLDLMQSNLKKWGLDSLTAGELQSDLKLARGAPGEHQEKAMLRLSQHLRAVPGYKYESDGVDGQLISLLVATRLDAKYLTKNPAQDFLNYGSYAIKNHLFKGKYDSNVRAAYMEDLIPDEEPLTDYF